MQQRLNSTAFLLKALQTIPLASVILISSYLISCHANSLKSHKLKNISQKDQYEDVNQEKKDRPSDENPGVPGYFIFCFEKADESSPSSYEIACGVNDETETLVMTHSQTWEYQLPEKTTGVDVFLLEPQNQSKTSHVIFQFSSVNEIDISMIAKATKISVTFSIPGESESIKITSQIVKSLITTPEPEIEAPKNLSTGEFCVWMGTSVPLNTWSESDSAAFRYCQCLKGSNNELMFGNCQNNPPQGVAAEDIIKIQ